MTAMTVMERPVTAEVLLYEHLAEAPARGADGVWRCQDRLVLRHIDVKNAGHATLPAYVRHERSDRVQIWLGGAHKKHDEHITVKCWFCHPIHGFGRRKSRDTVLVLDGLEPVQILLDGQVVWDSRAYFPLYKSRAIWEAAYKAQRELEERRHQSKITAQEYLEAFKALVASANLAGRLATPAELPWVPVHPGESLTDYEP
jgi:hypothetical protein